MDVDLEAVYVAMPVGLAVVDAGGAVREANAHVLAMLDLPRDEVVGRSVLDFTHRDDLGFVLDLLVDGGRRRNAVVGPARVRCLDARGAVHTTDLWARNCIGVEGVDGFVITIAEESVGAELAAAMRATVSGAPLEVALDHVVAGLARHPFASGATVLASREGMLLPTGPWPLGSTDALDERSPSAHLDSPWELALRDGVAVDVAGRDDMPDWLRSSCRRADVEALWCRPIITGDRQVSGVLVVWRSRPGPPTVNQSRHLADVVATTALAFDQVAYRNAMERAVFTDALTGLGNRARLEQLLGLPDDDIVGVLYIDLDGFKGVNDQHGHATGDEVLVQVGDRLRNALRSRDEVLRVGGDEFVVICRAPGSPGGLDVVADRVAGVLGAPYLVSGSTEPLDVPASIGADSGEPGRRLSERVAWADEAMYSAKTFGKSTWRRRLEQSLAAAAES